MCWVKWLSGFAAGVVVLGGVIFVLCGRGPAGSVAVISVKGQEVARIDLSQVEEPYSIQAGEHNSVRIEPGCVYMEQADCPDQLCVKTGKISKMGVPIVCLPNKVVVQIIEA